MLRFLLVLYFVLGLLNIYAEGQDDTLVLYISKPLLLTTLSLWFYLNVKPLASRTAKLILAGLIFSIGGDSLLMFVENGPKDERFFLFGLGSFLIAQVCYLLGFLLYPGASNGAVARKPALTTPFLLYLIAIVSLLWSNLPGPMRIPVTFYSVAILSMATAAFNLRPLLSQKIFLGLMAGVLLFVFSDSLIAFNKFMHHAFSIPYPRVLIMVTYLVGQYFIASRMARVLTTGQNAGDGKF